LQDDACGYLTLAPSNEGTVEFGSVEDIAIGDWTDTPRDDRLPEPFRQ
jgi:hypothetical protein